MAVIIRMEKTIPLIAAARGDLTLARVRSILDVGISELRVFLVYRCDDLILFMWTNCYTFRGTLVKMQ